MVTPNMSKILEREEKKQSINKARLSVLWFCWFVNTLTIKLSQKSTQSYIKFFADKLRQVLILYWHYWNTLTKTEAFLLYAILLISSDGTEKTLTKYDNSYERTDKLRQILTPVLYALINPEKWWRAIEKDCRLFSNYHMTT